MQVDEPGEYAEHDDQPINYSRRYGDGETSDSEYDVTDHRFRKSNTALKECHFEEEPPSEDTVRTFCTEDTPALSTATSIRLGTEVHVQFK